MGEENVFEDLGNVWIWQKNPQLSSAKEYELFLLLNN